MCRRMMYVTIKNKLKEWQAGLEMKVERIAFRFLICFSTRFLHAAACARFIFLWYEIPSSLCVDKMYHEQDIHVQEFDRCEIYEQREPTKKRFGFTFIRNEFSSWLWF